MLRVNWTSIVSVCPKHCYFDPESVEAALVEQSLVDQSLVEQALVEQSLVEQMTTVRGKVEVNKRIDQY